MSGAVVGVFFAAILFACGGDDTTSGTTPDDAGNTTDSTTTFDAGGTDAVSPTDSGSDAGPLVTCTVSPCATQISMRLSFGCAVMSDHTVECWGANDIGQAGSGIVDSGVFYPSQNPTARKVVGVSDAVQVSTGYFHACALTSTGDVYCWGDNDFGAVGTTIVDGGPGMSATKVTGITGTVVSLSAGGYFTCARLADQSVTCWGLNSAGEIGAGTYDASTTRFEPESIFTPTPVPSLGAVKDITSGDRFSCALQVDGGVECLGIGNAGEHGNGTLGPSSNVPNSVIGIAEPVTALGRSEAISVCVIVAGGQVRCWGFNANDGIGLPDGGAFVTSPMLVPGLSNVVEIGAGDEVTCVRLSSGVVQCMGTDFRHQLGPNGDGGGGAFAATDVPVTDVVSLSVGDTTVCVLQKSGAVLCWGDNTEDGLGRAADASASPTPAPVQF